MNDTVVYPKESEWFGILDHTHSVVALEDQKLFTEDWLGLKTLKDNGKILFYSLPGDHMTFESDLVLKYLIPILASNWLVI